MVAVKENEIRDRDFSEKKNVKSALYTGKFVEHLIKRKTFLISKKTYL